MSYIRNETISEFSEKELIEIVKQNLDMLDIHYEEKIKEPYIKDSCSDSVIEKIL